MTGEGEKATKFEIDGKSTAKNNNRNRFCMIQNYRKKCETFRPR